MDQLRTSLFCKQTTKNIIRKLIIRSIIYGIVCNRFLANYCREGFFFQSKLSTHITIFKIVIRLQLTLFLATNLENHRPPGYASRTPIREPWAYTHIHIDFMNNYLNIEHVRYLLFVVKVPFKHTN